MPRISTQEKYSIETIVRPSRNSCTAYALRNYSQKDVLSVQVTAVSVHAVLDCSSAMRWISFGWPREMSGWGVYWGQIIRRGNFSK